MLCKIALNLAGNGWWWRVTGARIQQWAECSNYLAVVCAWRCQLGSLGWRRRRGRCLSCGVSWWLRLLYQPSRCCGQLATAYNWDSIACWLYSRTWWVIWRSAGELQGCPLPTDRRTALPSVVLLCRAFYDHLARTMCLCPAALSCSHCDVVNPTLQIRRIGHQSAVALSSPMHQITADVPVSDIIIGLTLPCMVTNHSKVLRHGSHSFTCNKHHTCHLPRKRSPDGTSTNWGGKHLIAAHYSFIDPERMKGWVGLVGWSPADGLN